VSTAAVSYVIDAGVGAKLVLPEPLADRAAALFDLLDRDPAVTLHIPDLFYVECTNVLWKHVRRGALDVVAAQRGVVILRGLILAVVSTADLMLPALDLAVRHDISAYDACYVALSDRLRVTMVTADERLVRKLAGAGHQMEWLGAFTAPTEQPI
jgi:predicted nucleic acid-binding protein